MISTSWRVRFRDPQASRLDVSPSIGELGVHRETQNRVGAEGIRPSFMLVNLLLFVTRETRSEGLTRDIRNWTSEGGLVAGWGPLL